MRRVFGQRICRARLEALEPRHLLTVIPLGHPEPIVTPDHARPASMLAADFDLDGDVDLLAETAKGVAYFRNLDGRGDFQLVQVIGVSGADFVADLDSDGDPDLIDVDAPKCPSCPGSEYTVTTYLNNGQAQFAAVSKVTAGSNFEDVQVSDLDGDGDPDLVGFGDRHPVAVWLENDGAGRLQQNTSGIEREPSVRHASGHLHALVDMDSDGDIDLLHLPRRGANRVILYENTSNEFLEAKIFMVPGPQVDAVLVVRQFDNESDFDLIFSNSGGYALAYRNDLDNNTPKPSDFVQLDGLPSHFRQLVDFDLDGDEDLAAYNGGLIWYERDGDQFSAAQTILESIDSRLLSFADIDSDGDLDIAAATPNTDSVTWYENDGLTFEPHVLIEGEFDEISKVVPADLDTDGDLDFVTLDRRGIVWFQNMGDATFDRERIVAGDVNDLDIGDLEPDGRALLDIVYTTDSQTVRLLNRGWSQTPQSTVIGSGAGLVQIADINGDVDIDVVTAAADGTLTAYVNSMTGILTFEPVEFYQVRGSEFLRSYLLRDGNNVAVDFDIADVDEHGDADLELAIWFALLPPGLPVHPLRDDIVEEFDIADVDGDGDVDLVLASVFDFLFPNRIIYYVELLTTERQYFDSPTTLLSGFGDDDRLLGVHSVKIEDLNADGSNDLLWSGRLKEDEPDDLAWVEFGADGALVTHVIGKSAGKIELVDVNRDGRPEVFSRSGRSFHHEFRDDGSDTHEAIHQFLPPGLPYFGDFDGDGDVDVVVVNDNRIDLVRNLQERVDLDGSGQIDVRDVDLVWGAIQSKDQDRRLDLNEDGQVDERDGTYLLVNALRRSIADVNLDGEFNRLDLVSVLQAGKYRSDEAATWSQGDWNMDGSFDMLDLVLALQTDSYVA